MTVRVSTNKLFTKNFMTNFKYKVKSNSRVMIILLILHLVAAPLNLINLIVYKLKLGQHELAEQQGLAFPYPNLNQVYPFIGVVTTCLAAVSVLIITMNIYTYLYKKSVVDMTLSLPLTTGQRFFSDLLAGGFVYLAPYLASCVLALIINACGSGIVADWSSGEYGNITSALLTLIVAGFFIMLMAYTLSVLVATCCGSTFEVLAYAILVNGLIPATIAVFGYIFLGNLYGINLSTTIMPLIEKTSPIGGAIMLINGVTHQYNDGTNPITLEASWLIPYILITVIFVAGAYFLNKYRRAEQVSKPFVYKTFYYVMITMLTFCIGTLFTMENMKENITPLVIITAIIYLIFEVITNRGFRKLYLSAIRYGITIAAVIGLSLSIDSTGGFGAVQRVPDASNVKSIQMNYGGIFNRFGEYSAPIYVYDEPGNIESVIKMHNRVLKNYEERLVSDGFADEIIYNGSYAVAAENYSTADTRVTSISFTYNLKNGQHLTRTYSLSAEECLQMMSVDATEEFKENNTATIINYYNSRKKYFDDPRHDYSFVSIQSPAAYNYSSKDISIARADELMQCLIEDIKALPPEEYFTPSSDRIARISLAGSDIDINDNYTNVLMFFKKYGISIPTSTENNTDLKNSLSSKSIRLVKPEDAKMTLDGKDYYYNFRYNSSKEMGYDEYGNWIEPVGVPQDLTKLKELLKHVQADYITTEPCYFLYYDGMSYIVPPKYTSLAEELYKGAAESTNAAA